MTARSAWPTQGSDSPRRGGVSLSPKAAPNSRPPRGGGVGGGRADGPKGGVAPAGGGVSPLRERRQNPAGRGPPGAPLLGRPRGGAGGGGGVLGPLPGKGKPPPPRRVRSPGW